MQNSTPGSVPQNGENPEYLTLAEVARNLGLGRTKVYELVVRKEIPAKRFGERSIRVHRDDLKAYIDGCNL